MRIEKRSMSRNIPLTDEQKIKAERMFTVDLMGPNSIAVALKVKSSYVIRHLASVGLTRTFAEAQDVLNRKRSANG